MVFKRLNVGEKSGVFIKLAACFIAGALFAYLFWRLLGL